MIQTVIAFFNQPVSPYAGFYIGFALVTLFGIVALILTAPGAKRPKQSTPR